MATPDEEKYQLRSKLSELLQKVPKTIATASVQGVRDFKDWHAKATKTIKAERSTLTQLQAVKTQAESRYGVFI